MATVVARADQIQGVIFRCDMNSRHQIIPNSESSEKPEPICLTLIE
ncbi:MAG: hypothetical protein ACJA1J_001140 [Sulfitobacter pontiacus]